jgi:hypothetical protein
MMKIYEPSGDANDTALYKPETCIHCGGQMGLFKLKDTWHMRIDGTLHNVPVFSVPCQRCLQCRTTVFDGTSDEIIERCRIKYLNENGLNTRRHKVRRWIRRRLLCYRDRWNLWLYRTFYKTRKSHAA